MTTDNKITVLIVDDEPFAQAFIIELLKKFPQFQVIGECSNGEEAVEAIKKNPPDLVFLDI